MLAMVSGMLSFASAQAQQTRWLPASACRDGSLFADGIESGAIYSPDASSGAGPVASGNQQRQVLVGSSLRTYYVRVPPLHRADRPAPVLILLHGATGSSATTAVAAQDLRDLFSASADRAGVVLVAPPASGSSGGWVPAVHFIFIQAIQNDLAAAYVIDRQRRSVWGFSAGGHVAHGLVLGNAGLYAAYAVKAGVLVFSSEVRELLPLVTLDAEGLARLRAIVEDPKSFSPEGSTAIGSAIEAGVEALALSGLILRSLIVVTDGENARDPDPADVLEAVRANRSSASTEDFPVYTGSTLVSFIGFDIDAGRFAPLEAYGSRVVGAADQEELARVLSNLLEADATRLEAAGEGVSP